METTKTLSIYWKRDQALVMQEEKLLALKPENQEILERFRRSYSNGTKHTTIAKTLYGLIKYTRLLDCPLAEAGMQELENALYKLETSKTKPNIKLGIVTKQGTLYTPETKASIKKAIKQFYKWYEDQDPRVEAENIETRKKVQKLYKFLLKIKTGVKLKPVNPAEIIDHKDIELLLKKGCRNDMERAFLKTLHETGCRISEFLNIRLKDIVKKENDWIIYVDGKTGPRPVFLIESVPYLQRWLDFHPDNKPESYLWTSIASKKPLIYTGVRKLMQRVFRRAGLQKRHNPHWFRHSRASLHAGRFTEAVRCKLMGWSLSSNIPARYTHLKDSTIEDKFKEAHGLKATAEIEKVRLPIKCVCGRENEIEARYCSLCGKALSVSIVLEDDEKKRDAINEAFEIFARIMADPETQAKFEQFKQTWRKDK